MTVDQILVIIVGILGALGLYKAQSTRLAKAKSQLLLVNQEKETAQRKQEIADQILKNRQKNQEYESAKQAFKAKYDKKNRGEPNEPA